MSKVMEALVIRWKGKREKEERMAVRVEVLTGREMRLLLSIFSSVRWTHSHMVAGISVTLLYLHRHTIHTTYSQSPTHQEQHTTRHIWLPQHHPLHSPTPEIMTSSSPKNVGMFTYKQDRGQTDHSTECLRLTVDQLS